MADMPLKRGTHDHAYWLADKIPAFGDYGKECSETLRDLADRLAASNALCAELAEALVIAKDAMDERRSYVNGGDPSGCWQEMKYGEAWDEEDAKVSATLAKFKEATR